MIRRDRLKFAKRGKRPVSGFPLEGSACRPCLGGQKGEFAHDPNGHRNWDSPGGNAPKCRSSHYMFPATDLFSTVTVKVVLPHELSVKSSSSRLAPAAVTGGGTILCRRRTKLPWMRRCILVGENRFSFSFPLQRRRSTDSMRCWVTAMFLWTVWFSAAPGCACSHKGLFFLLRGNAAPVCSAWWLLRALLSSLWKSV